MRFSGRVQGVGFRATCRHVAGRTGVTGWARNEPDGAVLAEVQAEPGDIGSFFNQLRQTRAGGGIRNESRVSIDPVPDETGFYLY